MKKREASIQNRLNMLLVVCLIPLTIMILYLVIFRPIRRGGGKYYQSKCLQY